MEISWKSGGKVREKFRNVRNVVNFGGKSSGNVWERRKKKKGYLVEVGHEQEDFCRFRKMAKGCVRKN